ncbi:YtxH domain-containing protein [Domibacillus epiphyticus]|uniref:Uncharacterized protein n=1 Tax=Domibacillus epiphyticus TaxID=1714355 RepID=A0A1V2A4H9_9BACI|nr:YtxH domain-containing protein [Domibacillus epiphyticus]OMP65921.1 hypothetical protein BTO28_15320 [Domibacillus epiphyticus]
MEKTKDTQNMKHKLNSSQIKRSIAGGLIGAAVGYVAAPETGKKLIENTSPHKIKSTGSGIGQAVKEKSKKAGDSIKKSAGKIFVKKEDIAIEGYSNEEEMRESETSLTTGSENKSNNHNEKELYQESRSFNDRLDRLEYMLTKLTQAKRSENHQKIDPHGDSNDPANHWASPYEIKNDTQKQDESKEAQSKLKGQEAGKESQSSLQGPLSHKEIQSQTEGQEDSKEKQAQSGDKKNNETAQSESEGADNGNEEQSESAGKSTNRGYESLKKENEKLQDRLGNIEELLTKMLQENKGQSQSLESSQTGDEPDEMKNHSQAQNQLNDRTEKEENSHETQKKSQADKGKKQNPAEDQKNSEEGRNQPQDQDKRLENGAVEKDLEDIDMKKDHENSNENSTNVGSDKIKKHNSDKKTSGSKKTAKEEKVNYYNVLSDDEDTYLLPGLRKGT